MPSIRVLFDTTKVAKQHPTRSAKPDDACREKSFGCLFQKQSQFLREESPILRLAQSASSDLFSTHLLRSSADFVDSPLRNVEGQNDAGPITTKVPASVPKRFQVPAFGFF